MEPGYLNRRQLIGCGCGALAWSLSRPKHSFAAQAGVLAQCGSSGFGLVESKTLHRPVVDVCLNRQSFLERGWVEQLLGRWNNGARTERRGLFLSMFYAMEMSKKPHPWNEASDDWDLSLGNHINYYTQQLYKKPFGMFVYDNNGSTPNRSIEVAGRTSAESPFSEPRFINALAVATATETFGTIYIRTDPANIPIFKQKNYHVEYVFNRMDAMGQTYGPGPNGKRMASVNITQVLSHEAGHCFGIGHVEGEGSIMAAAHQEGRQRWQSPLALNDQVRLIATRIYG